MINFDFFNIKSFRIIMETNILECEKVSKFLDWVIKGRSPQLGGRKMEAGAKFIFVFYLVQSDCIPFRDSILICFIWVPTLFSPKAEPSLVLLLYWF